MKEKKVETLSKSSLDKVQKRKSERHTIQQKMDIIRALEGGQETLNSNFEFGRACQTIPLPR
jgi:hypothetical protein